YAGSAHRAWKGDRRHPSGSARHIATEPVRRTVCAGAGRQRRRRSYPGVAQVVPHLLRWVAISVFATAAIPLNVGAQTDTADEASARWAAAESTQAATRTRLGVLGDAFGCPEARFVSFRRSDAEPELADQWYVASQLWADALLLETATSNDDFD